ncbi:hypothetical protein OFN55_36250, partial [Escherichia coli]|nr:hypothetical protein [Escherichia coli]
MIPRKEKVSVHLEYHCPNLQYFYWFNNNEGLLHHVSWPPERALIYSVNDVPEFLSIQQCGHPLVVSITKLPTENEQKRIYTV